MNRLTLQALGSSLLTGALLFTMTGCTGTPEPFSGEELLVMVYSTDHEPILGALLRDDRRVLGRTDSFGRLVARGVQQGERRFLCYAPGFAPKEFAFDFRNTTQILYVSLEPLGTLLGRLLQQREERELARLLALLKEVRAAEEERTLVRALLLVSRGEAGWAEEISTLAGEIGRPRSETLTRALAEVAE